MAEKPVDREVIKLSSLMTKKVASVSPRTRLTTVCNLMARKRISCVVVTRKGRIEGIISERDIVRAASAHGGRIDDLMTADVMSAPVHTLRSDTTLERALGLVTEKGYRRFPIVDPEGTLVGIVTLSDMFRTFARELEVAHERMKDLAIRDCLTGMFNRRFFLASLETEFYRSRRHGTSLSLLMLDLDDFKLLNDRHGHQYGDQVLKGVAEVIRKLSRTSDVAARFGGEEFTVLLPGAGEKEACLVAERLREAIASAGPTPSVGVGLYPKGKAQFPDDLVRQADQAMYEAKRRGKNQVVCFRPYLAEKPS